MKRGKQATDEQVEEARRLRAEGESYAAISRKVGMSKATVISYCREIKKAEEPPGGKAPPETEPQTKEPEQPFNLMPSRDKVPASEAVTQAINQVRLQRLELERRQYERKLRLLDAEAEVEAEEKRVALNERRLRLQQGSLSSNENSEQAQALLKEIEDTQRVKAELIETKEKLVEQRHRLELDSLESKIADLGSKLDGRRLGAGEFDVMLAGMDKVSERMASFEKNAFAWLQSPHTKQQFDPNRLSVEQRQKRGEEITKKAEAEAKKAKSMPSCYQAGVGGYCANERVGMLPLCASCRYKPKETAMPATVRVGDTGGPLS